VAAGPRDLLASSFGGLARTLERAATASTYVAAGLLRFEALERHMATNWRHFGLAQSDPDVAEGLFAWEQRFYARFMTAGERVLVVGCGSGRDLVPLLEQGYRAEGLEPVAACAERARARLTARRLTAEIHVADIATAALPGLYDVMIFSWFCYSYLPLRARRLAVLRKARAHLATGGRILIPYVLAAPAARRLPWQLARLAARLSRSDWRPEYGDVFLPRADTGCIHYEHRFRPEEIEAEARDAGLAVTWHEHDGDGNLALRVARADGP
jgi:SAM-dependent methyltransferase